MAERCHLILKKPKGFEAANEMILRREIEGNNLFTCRAAFEEILQCLLDGERFPANLMMPVINRYQMDRYSSGGDQDKKMKKLLYVLWECLPKRSPDGKFMEQLVMVCGAFDKDLKHPNQYVCGSALRTLSKTTEPEVIRELVHSIEKCLEWAHAYQRKYAVLAISRIHKNFPDMNPSAPKLISEFLLKENDDECKRAALQGLLEIAPEEAKSYLHSCNIPDIHCMIPSIQLLFVEIIQKIYKKGGEEADTYLQILTSLIRSSSSPSVRYQAAVTLTRFSRDPDSIKLAADCFIDICSKDSDNNVKLIALDSLTKLKRIHGAERVLRNSIMDILFILQSATDLELLENILALSLELISPLNIGGVVVVLRQEIKKMLDINVLSSTQETAAYRRLLVVTVRSIANRFPHAMIEFEMLNALFDLLMCNTAGEQTSSRLITLFKEFMTNNLNYRVSVIRKIQESFNLIKDNPTAHRGLLQLLGDFSETKEQIEESFKTIKDSLGAIPIVRSETSKSEQMDGTTNGEKSGNKNVETVTKAMNRLTTADGSYATQTAIDYQSIPGGVEECPPLRAYYLKNNFETAPILCYALMKMACRYQLVEPVKSERDRMVAKYMFILAAILNAGHSNLVDKDGNSIRINNDQAEILLLGLNILQSLANEEENEVAKLMKKIVTDDMRTQLSRIVNNLEQEHLALEFSDKPTRKARFDDRVDISFFARPDETSPLDDDHNITSDSLQNKPDLFNEIPLSGTLDPIYAYCEFDMNKYDIGLKVHLENRTKHKTFENVTLELVARDGNSDKVDRQDPIVLAPKAKACITTNVRITSVENRRLFGSIAFDDVSSDDKEQVITLNDISVNVTDYIKPASISFDEFRAVWRDCEWENKVSVKTKFTSLRDYLQQLVTATNMRCITADGGLSGDCTFLSANLFAKSSFGEEALVNVSIEKVSAQAVVTGNVKIRSRSQGVALSLGEKITAAQSGNKAAAY